MTDTQDHARGHPPQHQRHSFSSAHQQHPTQSHSRESSFHSQQHFARQSSWPSSVVDDNGGGSNNLLPPILPPPPPPVPQTSSSSSTATSQHNRKRSADHLATEHPHVSRKGRACLACRKLKVKCDSLERGDVGCSRCQRLGLDCITSKRMRLSLDGDETDHPSIVRLDRAVQDILSKLKMGPLDSYGPPTTTSVSISADEPPLSATFQPQPPARQSGLLQPNLNENATNAQTTRENSREPNADNDAHEMAPAPMGSLYEVTQLNTLRSRLKYGDPARRHSRKNMETDLISLGLLSAAEAEDMLALFKTTLSRYLFDAPVHESRTLLSVRESSTLFLTAIITVTSLHIPGKEALHAAAHRHLRDLIAASFFDRFHTLEDIRALCIAAFWLPDLSWKLSGHCVRMATELNLHQAFYKALHSSKKEAKTADDRDRRDAFERARLWYLLYVLDHHFSIAYGRPPVTAELQAIKEYDVFLAAPECTPSDRRVLSQVVLFIILSKAYNHFGLEAERLMDGDDVTLLTHRGFMEDLERWRHQFRHALNRDPHVGDYPAVGVDLHYYFASMMLNSLALRGRSLFTISSTATLPNSLRPLASQAITSAHKILMTVLEQPSIRDSMVGVPLYLHTVIAFAVVFLIKMSSRWAGIGVSIDPEEQTKPLIEGVIDLFRGCQVGKGHILYAMADGFERLLRRNLGANGQPGLGKADGGNVYGHTPAGRSSSRPGGENATPFTHPAAVPSFAPPQPHPHQQQHTESYATGTPTLLPQQHMSPNTYTPLSNPQSQPDVSGGNNFDPYLSPHSQPTSAGTFGGWQTEDDMLWSMGMGYDLLATAPDVNAHGFFAWPGSGSTDGTGLAYEGL